MNKVYWINILVVLVIIAVIVLVVISKPVVEIKPVSAEPFTVDYFLENGKLAHELQTPLERYEQETIHK